MGRRFAVSLVCSALICGTALGQVFEEGRGHNHESSILRLRPEDSSGDSLGGHVGHAHVRQRGGGQDKKHDGLKEHHEEREHHGHKHHVHQDVVPRPEEFSLRKAQDNHDHSQKEAHNDRDHDHDQKAHNDHDHDQKAHNDHDHDEKEGYNNHGHDQDQQDTDHRSINPETQHAVQQRLQNPAEKHDHKHNENKHDNEYEENKEKAEIMSQFVALEKGLGGIHSSVWLASVGSIVVISLVGLLAVAALPLLRGKHRKAALQLLVSLAVGTLVGDSLIHLIPHAFGAEHGDNSVVWKGFTATVVIIAFFVLDRTMAALGHGHSHGDRHDEEEGSSSDETRTTRESTPDMKSSLDIKPMLKDSKIPKLSVSSERSQDSGDSGMGVGVDPAGSLYSLYRHSRVGSYQSLPGVEPLGGSRVPSPRCRCCSMPSSSLMVIVGDAVHNFADGLAVGAAFSLSLAAGFSTSVAVLCHELPHEVGDFALLLSQGMTVRTAIFYNIVSSVFAAFGLLAGLLLGSQEGLSSWLLSATVGVFLYVALVSMMTELQGKNLHSILLNTAGMLGGAVLLLTIGLYEHNLILLFEPDPQPHQH